MAPVSLIHDNDTPRYLHYPSPIPSRYLPLFLPANYPQPSIYTTSSNLYISLLSWAFLPLATPLLFSQPQDLRYIKQMQISKE